MDDSVSAKLKVLSGCDQGGVQKLRAFKTGQEPLPKFLQLLTSAYDLQLTKHAGCAFYY